MTELFPRVSATARGYDIEQVDDFFDRARREYESVTGDADGVAASLDAGGVRTAAFDLVRHGYSPAAVDAALDRLEAAFVAAERADFIADNGQAAWMTGVVGRATTLYERLTRPPQQRFAPPARGRGYDAGEVDALLDRLVAYFDDGVSVTASQVRSTMFASAPRSRAYAEGPVDAYLDRVVDVLLAVE